MVMEEIQEKGTAEVGMQAGLEKSWCEEVIEKIKIRWKNGWKDIYRGGSIVTIFK